MTRLYMSMEISTKTWKLCFCKGTKKRIQWNLEPWECSQLPQLLEKAKIKLDLHANAPVLSCHEAGLQGFWIHHFLESLGVQSLTVDPASIEVNRRYRRAKTDKLDVHKLMNMLLRHAAGETGMWAIINVPSREDEDERRIHRELERLTKEKTQHENRILSLLRLHGPYQIKINTRFLGALEALRDWKGRVLPEHILTEIKRQYARWVLVDKHAKEILKQINQLLDDPKTESSKKVKKLEAVRGIGIKGSRLLVCELFGWRTFNNRKQIGNYLGLTGTPYNSGESEKDQGISKAGNKRARSLLTELAWLWLRYQPESDLTKWFYMKARRRTLL